MQKPSEVAPGVYALGTDIVNWYFIEDEGRLSAVDAGLPGFADRLEPDLAQLGYRLADVAAVVLTHADGDHTGVAPRLRAVGARVLVHGDDQAALRKPGAKGGDASAGNLLRNVWRPANLKILGHTLRHGGARPARIEDAETFTDGDVLDVPGRFRVIHTPGHTPWHCCLLLGRGDVLFAGDALITHELVTGGHGAQLMPSYFNVDTRAAARSLGAIEKIDAAVLLPGHGAPWRDGPAAAVASARHRLAGDRG